MSESIVQAFSRFWVLGEKNNRSMSQRDRRLERLMRGLTETAPDLPHDIWARYFLLLLRQQDEKLLKSLHLSGGTDYSLGFLIDQVVEIAPTPNRQIHRLQDHLQGSHNHLAQSPLAQQERQKFLHNSTVLSQKLLTAYLQEKCLYAAKETHAQRIEPIKLGSLYSVEECFQIAGDKASNPAKLLRAFNFRDSNQIRTYAKACLKQEIIDFIYKRENIDKITSAWGILKYVTKKDLQSALTTINASESEQTRYHLLICQSYQKIYTTTQKDQKSPDKKSAKQLPEPSQTQLQAICDLYNQHCDRHNQQQGSQVKLIGTDKEVLDRLKDCAQLIRNYRNSQINLNKNQISIDQEDAPEIFSEDLPPLDLAIQAEENELAKSIASILRATIEKIFLEQGQSVQTILKLRFGLDFTQADLAKLISSSSGAKDQSTVCRQIKRCEFLFLNEFVQALKQSSPETFPENSPLDQQISQLKEPVIETLAEYCRLQFYQVLETQANPLGNSPEVAESEVWIQNLSDRFKQAVETDLAIDLNQCSSTDKKLLTFVQSWLEQTTPPQANKEK